MKTFCILYGCKIKNSVAEAPEITGVRCTHHQVGGDDDVGHRLIDLIRYVGEHGMGR